MMSLTHYLEVFMNFRIQFLLLSFLLVGSFLSNAQTVVNYTVGSSGANYTTIQAAYNACTGANKYNITINQNYNPTETFPIVFNQLANKTATNNVSIRLVGGHTGLTISKTTTIFRFNGADYVSISGITDINGDNLFTIQNTTVSTTATTVEYSNDCINIAIYNLNIYGSSTGTTPASGVVVFGGTTGTVGNECYFNKCTIGKNNTTSMPYQIISSNGNAAAKNSIRTNLCSLINFSNKAIFIDSVAGNSHLNMSYDDIYQTANYTIGTAITVLDIGSGDVYINEVTIGGQAADAAGTPFVIPTSATSSFTGIAIRSNVTSCTVTNASIKNISLTTTKASGIPFIGIENLCPVNSAVYGTIGEACTVVNNATGGTSSYELIRHMSTGQLVCYGGSIGNINCSGTNTAVKGVDLHVGKGQMTVSSATIGRDTISNNSSHSIVEVKSGASASFSSCSIGAGTLFNSTGQFFGVNSLGTGLSFDKCAIRDINLPGTNTVELIGINNQAGTLNLSYTSFYNLSTGNNAALKAIRHAGATASLNACEFTSLTHPNAGANATIKLVEANSTSLLTLQGNVFGNTTAGNISVLSNSAHTFVSNSGSGGISASNNTFQNLSIGNGGNATTYACFSTPGPLSLDLNTFQNISVNTSSTADFAPVVSSSASSSIQRNTFSNIQFTNATNVANVNQAILVTGGSGTIEKNKISGLSNASTSLTSKVAGITVSGGSWNLYNNVVLLNNNALATSPIVQGILLKNTTGANTVYHNTVKIFGSQTGNASAAAIIRTAAATANVRNNVFQNLRTGGTLGHYAESTITGGYTTNNNYLEASTATKLCNFNGSDQALSAWITSTSANSSITGATTLNAIGRQPAGFAGASSGANLSATVASDIVGVTRPVSPALGAYQLSVVLSITSIAPTKAAIGSSVTISGTGFSLTAANNTVRFNGIKATVTNATATQLTVTVPAGASYGEVNVVANNQIANSSQRFNVTNTSNCVYFDLPIVNTRLYGALSLGDYNDDGNIDVVGKTGGTIVFNPGNGTGTYASFTNYTSASGVVRSQATDHNRDGLLDLVELDYGGSLFLNTGAAVFASSLPMVATGNTTALGDINKDGLMDWVSINGGSLIWAYGNGVSFSAYNYTAAASSRYLQLADVNNDGNLDVIVCRGTNLCIYLGNSSGLFTTGTDYSLGTLNPQTCTLGDFDNDGDLDIATANGTSNSFSVMLNAGSYSGTFPSKTDYTLAYDGNYLTVGDINGDGNLDLLCAMDQSSAQYSLALYFGAGNGTFGNVQSFILGTQTQELSIGDFNKDGKQDLICIDNDKNAFVVLLNTCALPAPYITDISPSTGPVGTSVILTGNYFDPVLANNKVYVGTILATVTAATSTQLTITIPAGAAENPITVVVNGKIYESAEKFNVSMAQPSCINTTTFATKVDLASQSTTAAIATADLNGDGKRDMVAVNNGSASVSVYMNTSTGTAISFSAPTHITTSATPYDVELKDLDMDGRVDMAVTSEGFVTLYRNTGAGSFATGVAFSTAAGAAKVEVEDMDLDGKNDVVVCVATAATNTTYSLFNKSTPGTLVAGSFVKFASNIAPSDLSNFEIIQLRGDHRPDLVFVGTTSDVRVSENTNYPGNGAAFNGSFNTYSVGTTSLDLFCGDVDGDGKVDIVTANSGSNNLSVLRNTSTTTLSFATAVNFTLTGATDVVLADVDGDGKPDLVTSNNVSGFSVFRNTGTAGTISFAARVDITLTPATTLQGKCIVAEDFNQDGKPDVVMGGATNSNTISLFRNRALATALLSGTTTICDTKVANLNIALTGDNDWTVVYSNGSTNTTISNITSSPYTLPLMPSTTTTYSLVSVNSAAVCPGITSGTAVVTVNPLPTVLVPRDTSYCGQNYASLKSTVTFGKIDWYTSLSSTTPIGSCTPPASFTTPSPVASSQTYYAEAVSAAGCTSSIRKPLLITIVSLTDITPVPSYKCSPDTLHLQALVNNANARVRWYSQSTGGSVLAGGDSVTKFITPVLSTTQSYFVAATLQGCTTSPRMEIKANVNTIPVVINTTSDTICGVGNVILSAAKDTGTVYWFSAPTGGVIRNIGDTYGILNLASTTTYYVEVNNNGCITPSRIPVKAVVNYVPTVNFVTNGQRCDAGIVVLGARVTGNTTPVRWYNVASGGTALPNSSVTSTSPTDATFNTPSISSNATYYMEAGAVGCVAGRVAVTATVYNTPGISGTDAQRCGTGSVILQASSDVGAKLKWFANSSGGLALDSGATYNTPALTNPKAYYVEASQGPCKSSRIAVNANVYPLPVFNTSIVDPSACTINDGSILVGGLTPATSYEVSYNGNTPTPIGTDASGNFLINNLGAGSYLNLTIEDANNCSYVNAGVSLIDPGAPAIDAGVAQVVCQGATVTLTADNPTGANLTWSTLETSNPISFVAAGSSKTVYSVTANKDGCINSDTVSVQVRRDQQFTDFPDIPGKDISDAPFTISAISSSGLTPTFISLNVNVATVSGSTVSIVGPGTGIIKAIQAGNSCYNPLQDSIKTFPVSGVLPQTITFGALPDIQFGDLPFDPGAFSSAGSAVTVLYLSSDTTIAKIVNGNIVALKIGTVTISAYALGATYYHPSDTVTQSLNVIVPPFTIFGRSIVEENSQENYFISPNSTSKYTFSWKYLGSNIFYDGDTISRNVAIYFTAAATDAKLRCRVTSIQSGQFVDVFLDIKVNHQINDDVLLAINCDSLKGTFTLCSGKYINDFYLESFSTPINSTNTDCIQGYSDFTKAGNPYTADLYLGETYNGTIKIGKQAPSDLSANYVGIWIDYNNNLSFDDPNEFLLSTYSSDSIIELKNILINANSSFAGNKRLRVRVRSSGLFKFDESCFDYNESGETEDYKVTLVVPDELAAPVLLTPNNDGKNDQFVIKGIKFSEETKLTIFDRTGKLLFVQENYQNDWSGLDKDGEPLVQGTYFFHFVNGNTSNSVIRGYFELRY
jgi:gliding motility-associated-like protein